MSNHFKLCFAAISMTGVAVTFNAVSCYALKDAEDKVRYVNTFIGTAPAETHTAGLFGKGTEELG